MTQLALPLLRKPGLKLSVLLNKLAKDVKEATKHTFTMRLETRYHTWQLDDWCFCKLK